MAGNCEHRRLRYVAGVGWVCADCGKVIDSEEKNWFRRVLQLVGAIYLGFSFGEVLAFVLIFLPLMLLLFSGIQLGSKEWYFFGMGWTLVVLFAVLILAYKWLERVIRENS